MNTDSVHCTSCSFKQHQQLTSRWHCRLLNYLLKNWNPRPYMYKLHHWWNMKHASYKTTQDLILLHLTSRKKRNEWTHKRDYLDPKPCTATDLGYIIEHYACLKLICLSEAVVWHGIISSLAFQKVNIFPCFFLFHTHTEKHFNTTYVRHMMPWQPAADATPFNLTKEIGKSGVRDTQRQSGVLVHIFASLHGGRVEPCLSACCFMLSYSQPEHTAGDN